MDVAEDTARKQSDLRSLWVSLSCGRGTGSYSLGVVAQHLHGERASAEQRRAPRRRAAEAGTPCALSAGER